MLQGKHANHIEHLPPEGFGEFIYCSSSDLLILHLSTTLKSSNAVIDWQALDWSLGINKPYVKYSFHE